MKFRAVIVEDEEQSRKRLVRLLENFRDIIEIVGEAEDGVSAIEIIRAQKPDILFLDIGLPGLDGFQLLANLGMQPIVIFTTASNQYALEAFKANAIDYLIKPIDQDELFRAVEKLRNMRFNTGTFFENFERLAAQLGRQYLTRITCKLGDKLLLLKTSEILCFQSDNKYTSVQTSSRQLLIDTPLIDLERKLDPKDFIRIHRGTIVNVSWISEFRRNVDGRVRVILMNNPPTELLASKTYSENLRHL